MSEKTTCPSCGFIAHAASSDGKNVTYVCERCRTVFTK